MQFITTKRGFMRIKSIYDLAAPLGGVIAGSYPAWCAAPREHIPPVPGDVDIFPVSEGAFSDLHVKMACQGQIIMESETAVSYDLPGIKVQLVKWNHWGQRRGYSEQLRFHREPGCLLLAVANHGE